MNLSKKDLNDLRGLRELLQMGERNGFSIVAFDTPNGWQDDPIGNLPTSEKDVTPFIRERTRLWRETWILPVLDRLIRNHSK